MDLLLPLRLAGATPQTLTHLSPQAAAAGRAALPSSPRRRRSLLLLRLAASSSPAPPPQTAAPKPAAEAVALPPRSRWVVAMEKPRSPWTRAEAVDYYVETLARVLGSEKEAQMRIYDVSWERNYGFCCEIDEGSSRELARMPGVISVSLDKDKESRKDHSVANLTSSDNNSSRFFPPDKKSEYWLVRIEKPGVEVVTKAQMVDYYTQILTKVLGNEQDAQVCIYHISWEREFGFCCQLDEECVQELADVPGVLSVRPDMNFGSDNKDYRGDDGLKSSEGSQLPAIKTKRLFVTGLSFYTSEKTLRAAFEPFGELVEVKIIMDKISKRSKGYAFIEYTTEEAAGAALKEMNGEIINGWMIVVDVARSNPRGRRPRPSNASTVSR